MWLKLLTTNYKFSFSFFLPTSEASDSYQLLTTNY